MTKKTIKFSAIFLTLILLGCANPPEAQEQPAVQPNLDHRNLINVSSIKAGDAVTSPLEITGEAVGNWYFEASFPVELRDSSGNLLASTPAQAQGDWMTENLVPFKATLSFSTSAADGTLILKKDNPSGLPENEDQISIPVKFGLSADKTEVKVFFNNEVLDPEMTCEKVFPVIRTVAKTGTPAKAALEELLKGPTEAEKANKYSTALNEGVTLKSVVITDGVAIADFDEQLGFQVGGSCRVGLIRRQIEETLKQFPEIKTVKIAINGVSDDTILQP